MFQTSRITLRLFLILLLLIGSIFAALYVYSVPMIRDNVYRMELNTNRQILNIVYDLAHRIYFNRESQIKRALQAHQTRLRAVIDLTEDRIKSQLRAGRAKGLQDAEIWQGIYADLRKARFESDGYIWVAGHDGVLHSHPSEAFNGRNMANYRDSEGQLVIAELVRQARQDGEGFYPYKWHRLNDSEAPLEKYSYVRDEPQWGFVIGAGVYMADVQEEIESQRDEAMAEISKALVQIKIAQEGYLYIFDSKGEMLYHPNANIHGKNFREQVNPVTGQPIYQNLIAVADSGKELYYKWDKPDDPGHYVYEKMSLVRHFPEYDWYISSSVYLDDLRAGSQELTRHMIAIGLIGMMGAVLVTFFFAGWITSPLRRLSQTAYNISRGSLDSKTGIRRNDELGVLAESFDAMVDRLRDNIESLNERVQDRTSELRELESRHRMILDSLPAQIAYVDANLNYLFANQAYLDGFERTLDSTIGHHISEVLGEQRYQAFLPYMSQTYVDENVVFEHPMVVHGQARVFRRSLIALADGFNKVSGYLILAIDITREKEADTRMAQASKMKAVGQMSGGLAHDFNNLLTVILGNLLEMQTRIDADSDLHSNLDPAIRATRRGADITRRLLAFARRQPLNARPVRLERLFEDLGQLLKASIPGHVQLQLDCEEGLPLILVDSGELEDALVNLCLNAVDAMKAGGALAISARELELFDEAEGGFDETVPVGKYLELSVSDTGTGFGKEALKKALEPFFTTKAGNAGSGLGLSMVFGFVKQSGGYMRLVNRPQGGARVELLLPVCEEACAELAEELAEDPELTVQHTEGPVLLVEDDPDVRAVVRRQLLALGYPVVEAANGEEARMMLEGGLNQLAGLLSDVIMPGNVDCMKLVELVRKASPAAFLLLMTGFSDRELVLEDDVELIRKPFGEKELKQAIARQGKGVRHE